MRRVGFTVWAPSGTDRSSPHGRPGEGTAGPSPGGRRESSSGGVLELGRAPGSRWHSRPRG
eukprot:7738075-Alexandrium_andersonii.AAC.1